MLHLIFPRPPGGRERHTKCSWAESVAFPHGGDTIPSKVLYVAGTIFLNLYSLKLVSNSKANLPWLLYDLLRCSK